MIWPHHTNCFVNTNKQKKNYNLDKMETVLLVVEEVTTDKAISPSFQKSPTTAECYPSVESSGSSCRLMLNDPLFLRNGVQPMVWNESLLTTTSPTHNKKSKLSSGLISESNPFEQEALISFEKSLNDASSSCADVPSVDRSTTPDDHDGNGNTIILSDLLERISLSKANDDSKLPKKSDTKYDSNTKSVLAFANQLAFADNC